VFWTCELFRWRLVGERQKVDYRRCSVGHGGKFTTDEVFEVLVKPKYFRRALPHRSQVVHCKTRPRRFGPELAQTAVQMSSSYSAEFGTKKALPTASGLAWKDTARITIYRSLV
jgi:hypothetical protein